MQREKLVATVTAAQNGDNEALNTLFNAFYNDVYYFALKTVKDSDLACDITQETFVEIINTLGQLQEPAAFVTWMKQITYHQCTRYFRKKQDVLADEDEEGNTIFDTLAEDKTEFIPDAALDQQDFRETILAMIDGLSEEQRSATLLYYFDELSVKQIAEIQGCSEGTVKSRLNYARKAIKTSVEDYEKKNGIKLHSFGILPLLLWLLGKTQETIPLAAAQATAAGITATTGTAVSVSAGAAAASAGTAAAGTAAAAGTGFFAKIAAMPVVTKVIAAVLAGTVAAGSIGLALSDEESSHKKSPPKTTNPSILETEPTPSESQASEPQTSEPSPSEPVLPATNEFFNSSNFAYDINLLSIKPRHVYWQDGKLVAECFVINGFSHTVYGIEVKSLRFSNNDGLIAETSFGSLEGMVLAPYQYAVHTFIFPSDCISAPGVSLSFLQCDASTSNRY